MIFSSYPFLLAFLPAALIGFYALRAMGRLGASLSLLLVASLIFYAVWNRAHLALLALSIATNYVCGRVASSNASDPVRRAAMLLGVLFNLSLIFWFKYLGFAGSNIAGVVGAEWTMRDVLLPLGISFYTFQQIAYVVDCWKTRDGERSLRDYALFVTFFPQLIAGPIVHHRYTRPQFSSLATSRIDANFAAYGLLIFAFGLAKKTVLADPIARAIDPIWASAAAGEALGAAAAWTATVGYTLQIYFDFSGYCDMAIGLGLFFGVRLPVNFRSPYQARSIIDFWRRWHMTLSAFLRDYVYIPLGGNRGGEFMRLRNIFLTMLIGGLWHGAAWTFVIWGAIHATLITANHAVRLWVPGLDALNSPSSVFVKRSALLAAIMFAWIFFRADGLDAAATMIVALFSPIGDYQVNRMIFFLIATGVLIALFSRDSLDIVGYVDALDRPFPPPAQSTAPFLRLTPMTALATAVLLAAGFLAAWRPAAFIYYNF
jgi:D-alanyl-lipoteichoic acid acyltransferase DltB (MBOAT superfamily)